MTDSKIGIAIIGSGIFVTEKHLPAVQACETLELKAIYSRTFASAQKLSDGLDHVDLYSEDSEKTFSDLLARKDIRAVIIALPIPVMPAFIKQALDAGKHVLAEKPLAKDVATGLELLNWYQDNVDTSKVFFGIAENWRFLDVFAQAAERIQELGKVQMLNAKVHFYIAEDWKYNKTAWRRIPEFQGGYILDVCVHQIAGIRRMLGPATKIKSVCAFATVQASHLPPVDTVATILQFDNGSAGTFSASFATQFKENDINVACEGGTVNMNLFTSDIVSTAIGAESKREVAEKGGDVEKEIAAWAKSLSTGVPDERQSPWEALADLEVIEAMLTSHGHGLELKYQL